MKLSRSTPKFLGLVPLPVLAVIECGTRKARSEVKDLPAGFRYPS
jgi:hypothetical protein